MIKHRAWLDCWGFFSFSMQMSVFGSLDIAQNL